MAKGTLALRQIKLGDNADTSKNFVIAVPAVADGTLVIERGNGTDVLSIAADGKVTIPGNVQTWQDVKASRALGTTYTNSTGFPITVAVSATSTAISLLALYVNGVAVYNGNGGAVATTFSVVGVIPAGASYSIVNAAGTPTVTYWSELR